MGKGSNASKNKRAREDKLKRLGAQKAGGGGAGGKAERTGATSTKRTCMICRSQFMMTQNREQLMTHVSSKHADRTFEACFPDYSEAAPRGGAGGGGTGPVFPPSIGGIGGNMSGGGGGAIAGAWEISS
mmetsp:Transcript_110673/g.307708  ORF Transcript_110673/g.307708 Transcript_110673/m.307708 type:complete len:129 (-) Transcript_110673:56-442(-)